MIGKIKINWMFGFCAVLTVILACNSGNEKAEANKLVSESNKKLNAAKELFAKTEERNKTLFSANIQTAEQLADYKKEKNDEAKSIVSDYEKVYESLKEVSKLFDDVSRLNLDPKYKEFAKLKSDEYSKRAEAVNIRKGNGLAFIEIDDQQKMTARFDENNTKADKVFSEADELAQKARKIEEENKEIFVDLNEGKKK